MKLKILSGICVLAFIVGCTLNVEEESKEITLNSSTAGLTKITMGEESLEDNDIEIQGINGKNIVLTVVVKMLVLKDEDLDLENLQLDISQSGEIGYSYSGDNWSNIMINEVSMEVDKTLDLDIKSVSGNIKVKDIMGSLTLNTTSGDVEVSTVCDSLLDTTKCNVTTKSGDVEINIDRDILAFIPKVTDTIVTDITIETRSGDITITVPDGFTACLNYSTKSGEKDISPAFKDHSDAKNHLTCTTKSGNLTIKAY